MVIDGVNVIAPAELSDHEIEMVVNDEIKLWTSKNKTLATVELSVEDDSILVTATEKSPIRRVRRITGYLSNMENFNDAKKAELASRKTNIA